MTDPSSRRVVSDAPGQRSGEVGTAVTSGFRVLVAIGASGAGPAATAGGPTVAYRPLAARTLPALRDGRIERPPLFAWPTWEAPTFHRFRKLGFARVQAELRALPDAPRPPP